MYLLLVLKRLLPLELSLSSPLFNLLIDLDLLPRISSLFVFNGRVFALSGEPILLFESMSSDCELDSAISDAESSFFGRFYGNFYWLFLNLVPSGGIIIFLLSFILNVKCLFIALYYKRMTK